MVEHDLAKVGVAGSSPVFRSKIPFFGVGFFLSLFTDALVVELVDTQDLDTVLLKNKNLSALREIEDVELRKFGEPFKMGIPSEARKGTCRD